MSQEKFNTALEVLLNTLLLRIASEQTKSDLRVARNFVEVANSLRPEEPLKQFKEHFLHKGVVDAIRMRNVHKLLDHLKHDVLATLQARHTKVAEHSDMILNAFANITEEDIGANFPWKSLCALYECGTPEVSVAEVTPRVLKFNEIYEDFLENMRVAFPFNPNVDGRDVVREFQTATLKNPAAVYDEFKVVAEPYVSSIYKQDGGSGGISSTGIFKSPNVLFNKLPHVRDLPLEEWWEVQVVKNAENEQMIGQMLVQLLITMIGLPPELFGGDLISSVRDLVSQELTCIGDAEGMVDADGNPDMNQVMGIAMNIFNKMQTSGQLDTLVANVGDFDLDESLLQSLSESGALPDAMLPFLQAQAAANEDNIFASQTK